MATKTKYYQVEDYASMTSDRELLEKFGYKAQGMSPLEGRDAVEVTYFRDDSKPINVKLGEYEEEYTDALNAVDFANAYESFDPDKNLSKRVTFGTIAISLVAILFCGLFLVVLGALGGLMILKPEMVEGFLGENAAAIIDGQRVPITRDFSFDLKGALDFVGISAITWDFIAYFFLATAAVMALIIIVVIVLLIRNKIARVNYNTAENLRYEERLAICRSAAEEAKKAMARIDREIALLKKPKKQTT